MNPKVLVLVSEASRLDPVDRESLLVRIQALNGGHRASSVIDASSVASEIYAAVTLGISQIAGAKSMPFNAFKKTGQYAAFSKAVAVVEDFVESLERDKQKKIAVRRWACRLVIEYMTENGVEIRWNNISASLNEISFIVDHYFPGYMASGLMTVVLNAIYKGIKQKPKLQKPVFVRRT